jgi:hypothetical protein
VTNEFDITEYIFTVTRDNASPNNTMLDQFEATAEEQREGKPDNLQQPWSLKRLRMRSQGHPGDVRIHVRLQKFRKNTKPPSFEIKIKLAYKSRLVVQSFQTSGIGSQARIDPVPHHLQIPTRHGWLNVSATHIMS